MFKVKLGEIVASATQRPDGTSAFSRIRDMKLKVSSAFKLKGIRKAVEQHLADYNEEHTALFEKYGEPTPDGLQRQVPPEKTEAFQEEWRELMETEVEIPGTYMGPGDFMSHTEVSESDLIDWLFKSPDELREIAKPKESPAPAPETNGNVEKAEDDDPINLNEESEQVEKAAA